MPNFEKNNKEKESKQLPEPIIETLEMQEIEPGKIIEQGGEIFESQLGDHKITSAAVTEHAEEKHKFNEDRAVLGDNYAAIFDGLGGQGRGNEASQIAAETITEELDKIEQDENLSAGEIENLKTKIANAVKKASEEILKTSDKGMATTASIVKLCSNKEGQLKALIANVGDSRVYLSRKGKLQRLTKDDSYLQFLIDKKKLPQDTDQDRNLVNKLEEETGVRKKYGKGLEDITTSALGGSKDYNEQLQDKIAMELVQEIDLEKDDTLVICGDGITDNMLDKNIEAALKRGGTELELAENMVRESAIAEINPQNKRSKPDDKTAVVIKI